MNTLYKINENSLATIYLNLIDEMVESNEPHALSSIYKSYLYLSKLNMEALSEKRRNRIATIKLFFELSQGEKAFIKKAEISCLVYENKDAIEKALQINEVEKKFLNSLISCGIHEVKTDYDISTIECTDNKLKVYIKGNEEKIKNKEKQLNIIYK